MSIANKIEGLKQIKRFDNAFYLIFSRIFFPQESINIYKYKGFQILIDHSAGDANGAREILTTEMYRTYLSDLEVKDKLNVLDLGANNGGFPLLLKSEGFEINKVVCVELNPNTFSRLKFNLETNLEADISALNLAVCGTSREIELSLGSGGASDNIYQSQSLPDAKKYKVKGKTFNEIYSDNFGNETVDICKMDVEGAEFEIFENENCDKIGNCKYLLIEIHHEKHQRRETVLNKLKKLNFEEINGENKVEERHYVHLLINQGR
jgi:FkbM family methyltransferase